MQQKIFNLKSHMKLAFYEDVRGYAMRQERAWMDRYKEKVDGGIGPQKAWEECLTEYNSEGFKTIGKK